MTSSAKPDTPSIGSLFDFLYVDRGRISSYFAQLFESGVLRSLKTTSARQDAINEEGRASIPGVAGYTMKDAHSVRESMEREFDAAWSLPLNVLNRLDEAGMIERDISSARMGQLVLLKGTLQIIDMRMVRELWKPMIAQELDKLPRNTAAERRTFDQAKKNMSSMTDIIGNLPHAVQIKLFSEHYQAWATLEPDFIIGTTSDLGLKHGLQIQGTWSLLGVLDALPELPRGNNETGVKVPKAPSELDVAFLKMFFELRKIFGRGYFDYGVTPIAILREVGMRAPPSPGG